MDAKDYRSHLNPLRCTRNTSQKMSDMYPVFYKAYATTFCKVFWASPWSCAAVWKSKQTRKADMNQATSVIQQVMWCHR